MAQSATEQIAAKLAARKANEATPAAVEVEDEAILADDDEAGDEDPTPTTSIKERAAAARAARGKAKAPATKPKITKAKVTTYDKPVHGGYGNDIEAEEAEDEEPTPVKAKASKPSTASKSTAKGKKPPSPAQIAAREAFAARSRERAANAAAAREPVQTPEQVRAKQNADRKAQKASIQATSEPPARKKTSNSKVVTPPSKASARRMAAKDREDAKPKLVVKNTKAPAAKAKAAPAAKAKSAGKPSQPEGETKAAVLALVKKGMTRRQIMDELDLSYASVFYHTKNLEGGVVKSARGRFFVKSPLDESGKKLRNGKTEEVSRSEHMRRQFLSGMEVGDIARDQDPPVLYQVAYTAVRSLMGDKDDE